MIFWVRNVTFPGCMKQGNPQRKDLKFPKAFYFCFFVFLNIFDVEVQGAMVISINHGILRV